MSVRDQIVGVARWGVRNAARIHYAEARPMPLRRDLPLTTDCSGFVTLCYFLAGAPDPNGLGYIGQGYTGTLLRHLPHIGRAEAQHGDIVVWGRYPGRHCAVLLEPGEDPLLASHGSERGPLEIRFSAEQHVHEGQPATWLDGLPLKDLADLTPGPAPGVVAERRSNARVRPGSDPACGSRDGSDTKCLTPEAPKVSDT